MKAEIGINAQKVVVGSVKSSDKAEKCSPLTINNMGNRFSTFNNK